MILNEVLSKQNVFTKIILKDGEKELSKELKIKIMRIRMAYNKIKKNFDAEVSEFISELAPEELKILNSNTDRTPEEEARFTELTNKVNSEYYEFLTQKGLENVPTLDDSLTESEYEEIVEVNAGNDVEFNGNKVVLGENILRMYKNIIPIGISIIADKHIEPFALDDFSSGRVLFYIFPLFIFKTMLQIIKTILQKFIDDIDANNTNLDCEQQCDIIKILSNVNIGKDNEMNKEIINEVSSISDSLSNDFIFVKTEKNLKTKMIMQVHDELVFEVPQEELETLKVLVLKAMELNQPLRVPLEVDINCGVSWKEG